MIRRKALFNDRWTAFGENNGILKISGKPAADKLKRFDIFKNYDDGFLESISQDISLARWRKDAILFEEGSYIDVAFYIVEGSVNVYLRAGGNKSELGLPIFDVSRTMAVLDQDGQAKKAGAAKPGETIYQTRVSEASRHRGKIPLLSAMDFDLPLGSVTTLGRGEIFGEIGALNGWPQSVTAKTASECTLIQIRLPALRELKDNGEHFKNLVDRTYRERALYSQLQLTPLFQSCDPAFIEKLMPKIELISLKPNKILTTAGEPAGALYLIRSGFLKLKMHTGESDLAVSYLSKGMTRGEVELLIEGVDDWRFTASSVGYTELVKISKADFDALLHRYPEIESKLWESAVERIRESGYNKKHVDQSEFIEFALEQGLVEGNSILLIDLETCTRCDDCVKACADTHNGRPRFIREGEKYRNFLVTRACYHCRDPVCLVGCPTGAIRRANVGDVVEIDEAICIGCSRCAKKCPYDAITMFDTGTVWPMDAIPKENRGEQRMVASKCDLCYTSKSGPACVKNCPNGSAIRVGTMDDFRKLMAKVQVQA
jgi:Fe-S-cluster-containing dehydrogenase component/CRP-like cAMP-binding protein